MAKCRINTMYLAFRISDEKTSYQNSDDKIDTIDLYESNIYIMVIPDFAF